MFSLSCSTSVLEYKSAIFLGVRRYDLFDSLTFYVVFVLSGTDRWILSYIVGFDIVYC